MIHWGIIHATQRGKGAVLNTVKSLAAFGQHVVTIFSDSGQFGAGPNLIRAIRELAERAQDDEFICVLDDDLELCLWTIEAVSTAIRTRPNCVYSLWTIEQNIPHIERESVGWIAVTPHRHLWGGAVVMSRRVALEIAPIMQHMIEQDAGMRRKPDALIYGALQKIGKPVLFHIPSLAEHTELTESTLGNTHINGETRGFKYNTW